MWAGLGTDPGDTCVDRWTIADGVLSNGVPERGERSTCNPHTKQKFKDFKINAEFNLGAGQNSGLYLRGRYELQLSLEATPGRVASYPGQLMDIYGWKRADVYAGGPPDSWQILEAVVVGNRVTATLNGKKVHDNALLPAVTGGAMDNDELAPGPIMIQGDHSKVSVPQARDHADHHARHVGAAPARPGSESPALPDDARPGGYRPWAFGWPSASASGIRH